MPPFLLPASLVPIIEHKNTAVCELFLHFDLIYTPANFEIERYSKSWFLTSDSSSMWCSGVRCAAWFPSPPHSGRYDRKDHAVFHTRIFQLTLDLFTWFGSMMSNPWLCVRSSLISKLVRIFRCPLWSSALHQSKSGHDFTTQPHLHDEIYHKCDCMYRLQHLRETHELSATEAVGHDGRHVARQLLRSAEMTIQI